MVQLARALALMAAVFALGSCVAGPQGTGGPGVGDKLADVKLQTLDGKATSLLDLTKGRVAVLKFGATWCGWCTKEIPELNQVVKAYPADKVAVVAIDVSEPASLVRQYDENHQVAFTTVLDPEGEAASAYSVSGIPVVIVADGTGKIVFRGYYTPFAELDRAIAPAVKALPETKKEGEKPM